MYLNYFVKIPDAKGKITRKIKGGAVYISYEYAREYDAKRKFNVPKRVMIGKQSSEDPAVMQPNQNYLKFFGNGSEGDVFRNTGKSSCIRIGSSILIRKILNDYQIPMYLERHFTKKDAGILLDLAAYSLICENNEAVYYEDYAYQHPLCSEGEQSFTNGEIADFLGSVTAEQCEGFLNDWNARENTGEGICIFYCAGDKVTRTEELETGLNRGRERNRQLFAYTIAYSRVSGEPLFYEIYPGNIIDTARMASCVSMADRYGYEVLGFVLDRGKYTLENIRRIEENGYRFMILVKGISPVAADLVLEQKGTFEEKRKYSIRQYQVHGKTMKRKLVPEDKQNRYFHIYHSKEMETAERESVLRKTEVLGQYLKSKIGTEYEPEPVLEKYYHPVLSPDGILEDVVQNREVIERELSLCGYYVLITSMEMSARAAADLYSIRDVSENLFHGFRNYFGSGLREQAAEDQGIAKTFVDFIAMIVRTKIYRRLGEASESAEIPFRNISVSGVLKELDKLELIRGPNGIYRPDQEVTRKQETLMHIFGLSARNLEEEAGKISLQLKEAASAVEG